MEAGNVETESMMDAIFPSQPESKASRDALLAVVVAAGDMKKAAEARASALNQKSSRWFSALNVSLLNTEALVERRIQRYALFLIKDTQGNERIVMRVASRDTPLSRIVSGVEAETTGMDVLLLGGREITYRADGANIAVVAGESPDLGAEPDPAVTASILKRALGGIGVITLPSS